MFFRNRYYRADLGRFQSRDPLGYADGMNLYAGYFVPVGTDPFGLEEFDGGNLAIKVLNWVGSKLNKKEFDKKKKARELKKKKKQKNYMKAISSILKKLQKCRTNFECRHTKTNWDAGIKKLLSIAVGLDWKKEMQTILDSLSKKAKNVETQLKLMEKGLEVLENNKKIEKLLKNTNQLKKLESVGSGISTAKNIIKKLKTLSDLTSLANTFLKSKDDPIQLAEFASKLIDTTASLTGIDKFLSFAPSFSLIKPIIGGLKDVAFLRFLGEARDFSTLFSCLELTYDSTQKWFKTKVLKEVINGLKQ